MGWNKVILKQVRADCTDFGYWYCLADSIGRDICFQIESLLGSVYQGVGESSLLIEIERLKL